jgi:hypothetical protein
MAVEDPHDRRDRRRSSDLLRGDVDDTGADRRLGRHCRRRDSVTTRAPRCTVPGLKCRAQAVSGVEVLETSSPSNVRSHKLRAMRYLRMREGSGARGTWEHSQVPAVSARNRQYSFPKESWRRRPDLNRGWRFCRPLPYHLATAPLGMLRSNVNVRPRMIPRSTARVEAGIGRLKAGAGNGIRTRDFDLGKVALYH